nr:unnamed protein product [Callosobruchus chinensis]
MKDRDAAKSKFRKTPSTLNWDIKPKEITCRQLLKVKTKNNLEGAEIMYISIWNPFVIYADSESLLIPYGDKLQYIKTKTHKYQHQRRIVLGII